MLPWPDSAYGEHRNDRATYLDITGTYVSIVLICYRVSKWHRTIAGDARTSSSESAEEEGLNFSGHFEMSDDFFN